MSNFTELASKVGNDILDETKDILGAEWDSLQDSYKEDVERVAKRLGKLAAKKLQGQDVEAELTVVKATIKNWQVVAQISAAATLEEAFWKGVRRVGETLGDFLVKLAKP